MDNKAKGIEGSKAKEFSASKRWFDNFKNRFGFNKKFTIIFVPLYRTYTCDLKLTWVIIF